MASLVSWAVLAAGLLANGVAVAAETQWWIADTPSDYAKAESRGIVVRPDGVLELGPRVTSFADDSLTTVWAIAPLADGSVAIAGDRGRIDRWTERDGIRPWARLAAGQVLSLLADGDGVVAGTGPEGLVYRVGARGDTSRIARTGERYVWSLAPAGKDAWYAATGTRGRLMRVSRTKVETLFDGEESNLVSLLPDGAGGVYAGGDSRGTIVRVSANGTARTVFDAGEDEIRALALGRDGALYAAALSAPAVMGDGDEDVGTGPAPARPPAAGGRAVVYRIVPDSVSTTRWTSPNPYVFALLATDRGERSDVPGAILAATGSRAAIFRLDGTEGATQWFAAAQGHVTALAARGEQVFAATSSPAALLRLGPGHAERGELSSPALDARRMARFGSLVWRGSLGGARAELLARSGNIDPPDTTWSPWRGGAASEDGIRIDAPAARYLQWRLVLSGGQPRIASVEASWKEQNLPPRIEELVISPQGQEVREGEMTPRTEPVTQTLPGGQRVEYSLGSAARPRALRELPVWVGGLRIAQWRGSDPNGDPLRFRIDVRPEEQEGWIPVTDDLEESTWTFDTHALPDGRYRLRVVATDRAGNAAGEERTAEAMSAPFAVDNTAPAVASMDVKPARGSVRVEAHVEDAASTLSRIEVAIDGGDWRTVTPAGGFADARRLDIDTTLPSIKPGSHTVGLRAVDAAGNASTRAKIVTVTDH